MNKTIHKQVIQITDKQVLQIPYGQIRVLHAGLDPNGQPCIWYEVNRDAATTQNLIVFIVGTGNPIPPEALLHVGSFVQGPFVWHVYI